MSWERRVAALPATTLEAVQVEAALLTRVDRKYIVDASTWDRALAGVEGLRALEIGGDRSFGYSSVYYDTPGLDSYTAAARRRPSRYKVRTREYLGTGDRAIEVKLRSARGETVKHRQWLASDALRDGRVDGDAREFVASFPLIAGAVDHLRPSLTTRYERSTLVGDGVRVTIDRDVTGTDGAGTQVGFGDALIVETKSAHRAGDVDRLLWAHGVRPSRISKYCTTLAALDPALPSNRWTRTLRRHLNPTAVPAA